MVTRILSTFHQWKATAGPLPCPASQATTKWAAFSPFHCPLSSLCPLLISFCLEQWHSQRSDSLLMDFLLRPLESRVENFYNHWLHFALGDVVATMMSASISWQYFRVKHVNVLLTCWPPGLGSQGPQQGKVRPFIPFFFFSPDCFAFLFPLSLFHLHGGVFGNAVALFSIPHPHPC